MAKKKTRRTVNANELRRKSQVNSAVAAAPRGQGKLKRVRTYGDDFMVEPRQIRQAMRQNLKDQRIATLDGASNRRKALLGYYKATLQDRRTAPKGRCTVRHQ